MTATSISPERILKDLAKLWVDLAKDNHEKNAAGVLRACSMTLIVAVEEQGDADAAGGTIAALIHNHPSRAIVLDIRDGASGAGLDARVFAQCWMPFGKRQQICSEEIEITAPEPLLADVPKLLLALIVPDLPVVLWVRCPRMAVNPEFQKIFPLTSKIVIDSSCFGDADVAFDFVAGMNRAGVNMTDLEWTRLTRWRQLVSQIFDDERNRTHLSAIEHVTIRGSGLPARYLSLWFGHALPGSGVRIEKGDGAGISSIEITAAGFRATISIDEQSAAVLTINGLTSRSAMPSSTEEALMNEEMSIIGPDAVFRRCFE